MLSQDMVHEPEWNNYGNKEYEDMCRVQFRKEHDKGISKELEKYSFSSEIISLADKMYTQVTKGGIKRGRSRVALIFSCVFNAYIELGNTKTSEELRKVFKLERRDASIRRIDRNGRRHDKRLGDRSRAPAGNSRQ